MTNLQTKIEKTFDKLPKLVALYERGATQGERDAAKSAIERVCPQYFLSDADLLRELGAI